jgi:hypothetical protein
MFLFLGVLSPHKSQRFFTKEEERLSMGAINPYLRRRDQVLHILHSSVYLMCIPIHIP